MDTKVSSKGQVVIPKAVRDRHGWDAGTELTVEDRPDGVLIRAKRAKSGLKPTTLGEVVGMVKYEGPPKTLADMEKGIDAALRERARKKGWGR